MDNLAPNDADTNSNNEGLPVFNDAKFVHVKHIIKVNGDIIIRIWKISNNTLSSNWKKSIWCHNLGYEYVKWMTKQVLTIMANIYCLISD